jgi:hypothetical protein
MMESESIPGGGPAQVPKKRLNAFCLNPWVPAIDTKRLPRQPRAMPGKLQVQYQGLNMKSVITQNRSLF